MAGLKVVLAGKELHASHSLHVIRGIFVCKVCGAYSGGCKPERLIRACVGELSKSSQCQLDRLKTGRLPSGIVRWPEGPRHGRRAISLA